VGRSGSSYQHRGHVGYLEAVLEDGDPGLLAAALDDIARAQALAIPR